MKNSMKYIIALVFCLFGLQAAAKDPVSLIIPTGPGGLFHLYVMELQPVLSKILEAPVVVEFYPGGDGAIAVQALIDKKSKLSMMFGYVNNPSLKQPQYAGAVPAIYLGALPGIVVSHPSFRFNTLREVVGSAPFSWSIGGVNGACCTIWAERFVQKNKTNHDAVLVQYKTAGSMQSDIMGNHINMSITGIPPVISAIREGKLKALGIVGSHRSHLLPDVPTVTEQGIDMFEGPRALGIWANPKANLQDISSMQSKFQKWLLTSEAKDIFYKFDIHPSTLSTRNFIMQMDPPNDKH